MAVRNLNAVQTDNATQENAASNAEQSGDSSTSAVQENVVDTKSMLSSNAVQESNVNTDVMQQLNAEQETNAKLMLEQNTDTAMQASAAVQANAPVREDNAEQELVEGESKQISKRRLQGRASKEMRVRRKTEPGWHAPVKSRQLNAARSKAEKDERRRPNESETES